MQKEGDQKGRSPISGAVNGRLKRLRSKNPLNKKLRGWSRKDCREQRFNHKYRERIRLSEKFE